LCFLVHQSGWTLGHGHISRPHTSPGAGVRDDAGPRSLDGAQLSGMVTPNASNEEGREKRFCFVSIFFLATSNFTEMAAV